MQINTRDLNVSDNSVRYIFRSYVDLGRLPLSEAISIDEVYMHFDSKNLYSLIIMDFISGEIIDILPNRLESTTSKYFYSISKEERNRVKYLICDMYNPYINYVNKYLYQSNYYLLKMKNHQDIQNQIVK